MYLHLSCRSWHKYNNFFIDRTLNIRSQVCFITDRLLVTTTTLWSLRSMLIV